MCCGSSRFFFSCSVVATSQSMLLVLVYLYAWYWYTWYLFSFLNDQLKKLVSHVYLYAVKFCCCWCGCTGMLCNGSIQQLSLTS